MSDNDITRIKDDEHAVVTLYTERKTIYINPKYEKGHHLGSKNIDIPLIVQMLNNHAPLEDIKKVAKKTSRRHLGGGLRVIPSGIFYGPDKRVISIHRSRDYNCAEKFPDLEEVLKKEFPYLAKYSEENYEKVKNGLNEIRKFLNSSYDIYFRGLNTIHIEGKDESLNEVTSKLESLCEDYNDLRNEYDEMKSYLSQVLYDKISLEKKMETFERDYDIRILSFYLKLLRYDSTYSYIYAEGCFRTKEGKRGYPFTWKESYEIVKRYKLGQDPKQIFRLMEFTGDVKDDKTISNFLEKYTHMKLFYAFRNIYTRMEIPEEDKEKYLYPWKPWEDEEDDYEL